jgi:hypothetical protein
VREQRTPVAVSSAVALPVAGLQAGAIPKSPGVGPTAAVPSGTPPAGQLSSKSTLCPLYVHLAVTPVPTQLLVGDTMHEAVPKPVTLPKSVHLQGPVGPKHSVQVGELAGHVQALQAEGLATWATASVKLGWAVASTPAPAGLRCCGREIGGVGVGVVQVSAWDPCQVCKKYVTNANLSGQERLA